MKKMFLIVGLALISLAFFWYEYRPARIRSECEQKIRKEEFSKENKYQMCIRSKGIVR